MNTALSWIKAYVPDLDVTAQEYTDAMTLSGSKVEGYTCLDKNLEKIVVGQIKKIERHPDADKLIVCQVDIGKEAIQIVTGAPNVKEGDKVPVVLDGGRVAGGHDGGPLPENGIKIKKGKLRGIESNGMMCSIEELGSNRDMYPLAPENGIYILPEDTEVGADAIEVLGLHDIVFEYEITSNRVDCYSVVGLAREAAATFRREFHAPVIKKTGNNEDIGDYLKVEVEDTDVVKTVYITLPPAYITGVEVDAGSLDYIFVNKKANNPDTLQTAYAACEADAQAEVAENAQLLELAQTNAEEVVRALTEPFFMQHGSEYNLVVNHEGES